MAISLQQLTIYIYSAHRAVIFAMAHLSCYSVFVDCAGHMNGSWQMSHGMTIALRGGLVEVVDLHVMNVFISHH